MFRQEIRPKLRQAPLPAMLQALSLLSMDFDALNAHVRSEVLSNPLLEYAEKSSGADHQSYIYSLPGKGHSLYSALIHQLNMLSFADVLLKSAAELIIGCLDEDGYLRIPLSELSAPGTFPLSLLQKALETVQSLDPPGIGAQNLQQCLLLQLDRAEIPDECARRIVLEHLDEIPAKHPQIPGFTAEQVDLAVRSIRALSPRPGLALPSDDLAPIAVPELEISIGSDGRIEVLPLTPAEPPRLSPLYREIYLHAKDPETALYIRRHAANARSLIRALARRRETLLAIGHCIASRQYAFFAEGAGLNPLSIADIARQLSMNSSTISRGIREKYLLFRGRVYPLHAFLAAAVPSGQSADQVKAKIAEILKNAGAKHISDQKIADQLARIGIRISRRTVNKYRRELPLIQRMPPVNRKPER